jgi:hypothetical protein
MILISANARVTISLWIIRSGKSLPKVLPRQTFGLRQVFQYKGSLQWSRKAIHPSPNVRVWPWALIERALVGNSDTASHRSGRNSAASGPHILGSTLIPSRTGMLTSCPARTCTAKVLVPGRAYSSGITSSVTACERGERRFSSMLYVVQMCLLR